MAVGLSGKDGRLITARQLEMVLERHDAPPEIIDLGKVGEVTKINTALITTLLDQGFIPVIAPVGVDEAGETYNINADTVAGAVASAMGLTKASSPPTTPPAYSKDRVFLVPLVGRVALLTVSRSISP